MEGLKEAYTEVWVPTAVVPLVRFADRAMSITGVGLDLLELPDVRPPAGLLDRLRGFDSIVSWYGAARDEFRAVVERLGLPFAFLCALPPNAAKEHAADFYVRQVRSLGGSPARLAPQLDCVRRDEGFIVIHPFSGNPRKNWPLERFREVAARIGHVRPIFWCAGPEEQLEGAERFDNLYDLASWLARSHLFLGNDSGITHLAAASGTRVVALFGPTDPYVWAPRGESVSVLRKGPSMGDIDVETVLQAILSAPC